MVLKLIRKAILGQRRYTWENQYSKGLWDYLNDHLEVDRFETARLLIEKYAYHGSILEVGCGEGLLRARMPKDSFSKFTGIDISKIAIKRASRLKDPSTKFLYADMEKYTPGEKFDVVLFNESLYYAINPVQLMHRYFNFIHDARFMILSIYETADNQRIMNDIDKEFKFIEKKITRNERGAWHCLVYAKTT